MRQQGATDVVVTTLLFELAGAFGTSPLVDEIVLLAGDSDFKPCLEVLLVSRPQLRICVVANQRNVQQGYLHWLNAEERTRFVSLKNLLQGMAPGVLDYEHSSPEMDISALIAAVVMRVSGSCMNEEESGAVRLLLSNNLWWGGQQTAQLCEALIAAADDSKGLTGLEQLWLHHTGIDDAACQSLGLLLKCTPALKELHISDTPVSAIGLRHLISCTKGRAVPLYINAR